MAMLLLFKMTATYSNKVAISGEILLRAGANRPITFAVAESKGQRHAA
jgi:hypothetical protein